MGAPVLVMGLAYKENCPNIRNTRDVDIPRRIPKAGRLGVRKDARQGFGLGRRAQLRKQKKS